MTVMVCRNPSVCGVQSHVAGSAAHAQCSARGVRLRLAHTVPGAVGPAAARALPPVVTHEQLAALVPGYESADFPEFAGAVFRLDDEYDVERTDPYPMTAQNYADDLEEPDDVRHEYWKQLERTVADDPDSLPPLIVVPSPGGDWLPDGNHRVCMAAASGVTHMRAYVLEQLQEQG